MFEGLLNNPEIDNGKRQANAGNIFHEICTSCRDL